MSFWKFWSIYWPVIYLTPSCRGQNSSPRLLIWQPESFLQLQHLVKVCAVTIENFHSKLWLVWYISFFFFFAVDQVQLDRAKESTKSAVLMNLESRVLSLLPYLSFIIIHLLYNLIFSYNLFVLQTVVSEDIGRQILTYGER